VIGGPAIGDGEFALLQALIQREAGIWLPPTKRALVSGRLSRRLRALGLQSYLQYYRRVTDDELERQQMLDCICTNETHFFREPHHFELLERVVLPAWRRSTPRGRRVRAWSAGCSTGEEPYSLAMVLRAQLPASDGWEIEIVATDLSTRVLDAARGATWPIDKAREIPERYLKAFMLRGVRSQEGQMRAGPELRELVKLERLNLHEPTWPLEGTFDLVFCRNVLIYFDVESKARVIKRLLERLAPGGYFFVGHSESLAGLAPGATCVAATVYSTGARK
jgi:chemotaxis protein methyltransferase CheR